MVTTKQQEIIDWAINYVQKFEKERKIYNLSVLIFTALDIFFTIVALFYSSMLVASVIVNILFGTTWGAKVIQLTKFEKALKILSVPSLAYITVRRERGEFMKNVKVRNIVIAVLNILAVASVVVCAFVPALSGYIAYAVGLLGAVLPADLYAVFNNAKLSAEEVTAKVQAKEKKIATAEAKAEVKAKQKAEIEDLAAKKLEEKNKTELS